MHSQVGQLLDWLYSNDPLRRPEVDRKLRFLLLDTIGCMLAGRCAPEVAAFEAKLAVVEPGRFRFPNGDGLSASSAALLGATAACWDEACEGLASAHGRPGVAAIAAALPLLQDATLEDALRSIATGYEVGARMGAALRIRSGMHVDANWPALGAAAAAARAHGLEPATAEAAVNIAACQLPYSLYLPIRVGATARNTYLGHAASLGVQAALAAAAGISAPTDAHVDYAKHALGLENLALAPPGEYLSLAAYLKPYAAVRHVHYGAAAAEALRGDIGGDAAIRRIERIILHIYEEAVIYCGNRAPQSAIQAQFSLSFGIAAMLRFGSLGPEVYRGERFRDPELRRLEALVEIEIDPGSIMQQREARVEIFSASHKWTKAVTSVKGDPNEPFTTEDCCDKFVRYAAPTFGSTGAAAFARRLLEADAMLPFAEVLRA
ncbi:MAG: MmgE/PrpD family protein [Casimicrobiaceae bacterium]